MKPLISYEFLNDMIKFIRKFWSSRQKFYPVYVFYLSQVKSKHKIFVSFLFSFLSKSLEEKF